MKHEPIAETERESVSPHKLINAREVRHMFGDVSKMTLFRWSRDPDLGFPAPIVISRRRFWRETELVDFIERQRELN